MQTFLAILGVLANIRPILNELIQTVETAFGPGSGAAKLEQIRVELQAAYTFAESEVIAFEKLWPTLAASISGTVAIFNAAGIFKKATPTVTADINTITQAIEGA